MHGALELFEGEELRLKGLGDMRCAFVPNLVGAKDELFHVFCHVRTWSCQMDHLSTF